MGISASKRVSRHFRTSQEFTSACTTVFSDLQTVTQHTALGKIFAYQLPDAAVRLHHSLSSPFLNTWCPSPPSHAQVDGAYRSIRRRSPSEEETLGSDEFREFAVVLFTDAVVSNASKTVMSKVGVGVAGIAGVGMVARVGGGLVGSAVGIYALGVATSVYFSLG